jgi:hypothetical protein
MGVKLGLAFYGGEPDESATPRPPCLSRLTEAGGWPCLHPHRLYAKPLRSIERVCRVCSGQPGGGPVLTDDNLVFARQLGVTHIIQCAPGEHLLPLKDGCWAVEDLVALRQRFEAHGLQLHAIENWHATMWGHILLGRDGPEREREMANLQQIIRNMGAAV